MHFMYTRYIISMFAMNRKILVRGLIEDLCKSNVANIDDLNDQVAAKLKQRRKKMSDAQRQLCDELELFAVLTNAY